MTARLVTGAVGVLLGAYGAWLLLSRQDASRIVDAATWLAAGVVLHDVVLAPLVVALAAIGARALPWAARGPATVALVVLGSVTLLAVPVLGRFGARADNPTLLDRPYVAGWLVLATLVVVAAAVATVVRARRAAAGPSRGRRPRVPGPGR
ncbi:hypothetical protein ACT8ZV_17370 [Nocardioides sp. MAHUQ-72]|uniref:hypothetical protein n=1 Tax=unclassified Nocardioides TaxID=2615069 RepID=UPI00360B50D1